MSVSSAMHDFIQICIHIIFKIIWDTQEITLIYVYMRPKAYIFIVQSAYVIYIIKNIKCA